MNDLVSKGRELTVREGFLVCPNCLRNKRLIRVPSDTVAYRLVVYCRDCKKEIAISMEGGRCYQVKK